MCLHEYIVYSVIFSIIILDLAVPSWVLIALLCRLISSGTRSINHFNKSLVGLTFQSCGFEPLRNCFCPQILGKNNTFCLFMKSCRQDFSHEVAKKPSEAKATGTKERQNHDILDEIIMKCINTLMLALLLFYVSTVHTTWKQDC